MDKLPQRDDLIYKEIEEFQDYELTNCIAYEMAIRNKDVIKFDVLPIGFGLSLTAYKSRKAKKRY